MEKNSIRESFNIRKWEKKEFSIKVQTPLNGKIKKMKNDLHALKQILYDMGHLTVAVARWLFKKTWKFKTLI